MSFELLVTEEAVCTDKHPSDPAAKIVACSSPEAGYQVFGKGALISADDAKRYGVKASPATPTYTLRLDSHTIAHTPEDKAYAATQPQFGLQMAKAEHIRTAADLAVASQATATAATAAAAAEDAKKDTDAADKKAKAALEKTAAAPKVAKAKKERKPRTKKAKAETATT